MNKKDFFRIGRTRISVTNPVETINKISDAALAGKGGYICVSNMRMIRFAGKDKEYKKLMDGSFMNLPDGTPLTWLGKLWGLKGIACTNGPALFKRMLAENNSQCRHYLLGDTEDVIADILKLNDVLYHANIVGAEALPFCNVNEFDYIGISKRLKETEANIVWTAMRAPKQDQFDKILCTHIDNVVAIGVGRAFRLLTGSVQEAPKWAQKMGIAGIFTRKVSLGNALLWYLETFFFLGAYALQILFRKLTGKKYYD